MKSTVVSHVPGKLYVAGEYSVLEKDSSAIIVAVDRFVIATVTATIGSGSIRSAQYGSKSLHWSRKNGVIVTEQKNHPFNRVLCALNIVEKYAVENGNGVPLAFYDLSINSELNDNISGEKYGLGSSSAVTVVTIKALLAFYELPVDDETLFKLCAIADLTTQKNCSIADLSAIVYGGWIHYTAFDREWLYGLLQTKPNLTALVKETWPALKIESLPNPKSLHLLAGWSGVPASTAELIANNTRAKKEQRDLYAKFIKDSDACVARMAQGFNQNDDTTIEHELRKNREILQEYATFSDTEVVIPELARLIAIAEKYDAAAKSSGAGKGDCGLALARNHMTEICAEWAQHKIKPLDIKPYAYERSIDEKQRTEFAVATQGRTSGNSAKDI